MRGHHGDKAQVGEAIDERNQQRSGRFLQRIQGIRGTAIYRNEDRTKSQVALRRGGDWKETKVSPDLWQISYAVTKRRAGRAPEGSGVPVGTEYHWYVLAHQNVGKQNANDYTTSLTGLKFKIAHKGAGTEKWSATPKTQRKRMIMFLQNVIADLEKQSGPKSDVTSAQEKSASERHNVRARRRAIAKPARSMRRAKRGSAPRRDQRAARFNRADS